MTTPGGEIISPAEETKTNIDQIMVVNTDSNFTLHNARGRETI
jgi:hypothetical protein